MNKTYEQLKENFLNSFSIKLYKLIFIFSTLLTIILFFFNSNLLTFWKGYYGNWRDGLLEERIINAPYFFLSISIITFFILIFLTKYLNLGFPKILYKKQSLFLYFCLVLTILCGVVLSYLHWAKFSYPCWDSYCYKAGLWKEFITNPSSANLIHYLNIIKKSHVGVSFIPPILIGTISYFGISVSLSFLLINFICWIFISLILVCIAKEFFDFTKRMCWILIFLLFGHLSIQRSLIFPQTDPFSIFMIVLVVYLVLKNNNNQSFSNTICLIISMILSFFVKISCFPILCFPIIFDFFLNPYTSTNQRIFNKKFITSFFTTVLAILCIYSILLITGLDETLIHEFRVIDTSKIKGNNYSKDNNILRLFIVLVSTFQLLLIFIPNPFASKILSKSNLLFLLILVFPISLIILKAAFWLRYVLPSIPFFLLLVVPRIDKIFKNNVQLFIFIFHYVVINSLYIVFNLYT